MKTASGCLGLTRIERKMLLKKGERWDDLQFRGLRVIQAGSSFSFGLDALLLADFSRVKRGGTLVELGAGNGAALLLLAHRSGAERIVGVEIDEEAADRARRSVEHNGLGERVEIWRGDLREAAAALGHGMADTVICNPPYFSLENQAKASPHAGKAGARHRLRGDLEDWVETAGRLLRNGGEACFVYRCQYLPELLNALEEQGLAAKEMQILHHDEGKEAKLLRLRAKKGGGRGLRVLPPLILHKQDGTPSPQWAALYRQGGAGNPLESDK